MSKETRQVALEASARIHAAWATRGDVRLTTTESVISFARKFDDWINGRDRRNAR